MQFHLDDLNLEVLDLLYVDKKIKNKIIFTNFQPELKIVYTLIFEICHKNNRRFNTLIIFNSSENFRKWYLYRNLKLDEILLWIAYAIPLYPQKKKKIPLYMLRRVITKQIIQKAKVVC